MKRNVGNMDKVIRLVGAAIIAILFFAGIISFASTLGIILADSWSDLSLHRCSELVCDLCSCRCFYLPGRYCGKLKEVEAANFNHHR